MFTTNYSDNKQQSFGALESGEYEFIIKQSQEKATKNGKEALELTLVVRNDLTQVPELAETNGKFANRRIWHDEWKRDISGQYIYKLDNLQYIFEAVGIPEGKTIKDIDELHGILTNKPVRVYVKKAWDDYINDYGNDTAPWNFKKTNYPNVQHVWDKNEQAEKMFDETIEASTIADEDIPF